MAAGLFASFISDSCSGPGLYLPWASVWATDPALGTWAASVHVKHILCRQARAICTPHTHTQGPAHSPFQQMLARESVLCTPVNLAGNSCLMTPMLARTQALPCAMVPWCKVNGEGPGTDNKLFHTCLHVRRSDPNVTMENMLVFMQHPCPTTQQPRPEPNLPTATLMTVLTEPACDTADRKANSPWFYHNIIQAKNSTQVSMLESSHRPDTFKHEWHHFLIWKVTSPQLGQATGVSPDGCLAAEPSQIGPGQVNTSTHTQRPCRHCTGCASTKQYWCTCSQTGTTPDIM